MGEMARTLVFTGEKQIEIQEYPIPEVSDDMVLVKTDACAKTAISVRAEMSRTVNILITANS